MVNNHSMKALNGLKNLREPVAPTLLYQSPDRWFMSNDADTRSPSFILMYERLNGMC